MLRRLFFPFLAFAILFTTACSNSAAKEAEEAEKETKEAMNEAKEEMEKAGEDLKSGLEQIGNALQNIQVKDANGNPVEAMDFRDLKETMPEKLLGMDRESHKGQRNGAAGFKISNAEAVYRDGDKRLEVNVVDVAGVGLAALGAAAWTMVEIDNESDDGYERTVTIDGNKAFEKFNEKNGDGELSVFYKKRYIISVKGRNIKAKDLRDAYDDLKLGKLE